MLSGAGAAVFSGCSTGVVEPDAGCMTPAVNDAGMRCECVTMYDAMGNPSRAPYCDPDIGNPCSLGCFNPREADGGRQYTDAGPVCFC